MKFKNIIAIILFFGLVGGLTSCLDGDPINTGPGAVSPFLLMTNNPNGTGIVNSGMQYFGNQALLYSPVDEVDTAVFAVSLQGTTTYSKDINVTLSLQSDALDDNFANDQLTYAMMPESYYEFVSNTGVIKAGERYAEFKVRFFPNKMDWTANTMLPISATNDAGLPIASNFGVIYYHVIGNPIAGVTTWKYRRWNLADSVGSTNGTASGSVVFAPINGTTVKFNGGYASTVGLNAPYVMTFSNTNGVLGDFKVTIDPSLAGGLSANGIAITLAPTIIKKVITPTYRYFKIWYKVNNGTGDRTLIDEYTWQP